ncbi:MAG: IMP 5'-nucleotidase [Thelocarpon superellum]|nr:MAG: IMP 5'-nucleotidase [Thelocarpon superellum]
MESTAHRRYAEIMRDVEALIEDHIWHQQRGTAAQSKLKLLVPSVGQFFTPLKLEEAFKYQDARRFISSRRFVPPSFNDIRLTLNTAQVMGLVGSDGPSQRLPRSLRLITFDADVTLYEDGGSLEPSNPVIPRMLSLLAHGLCIGIVTAAGYDEASRYHWRLHGLIDALAGSHHIPPSHRNLVVMGGESNYLFAYSDADPATHLVPVPRHQWELPEMKSWEERDVQALLDVAEGALRTCVKEMHLPAAIMRKERAVGIFPVAPESSPQRPTLPFQATMSQATTAPAKTTLSREQLEETVMAVQKTLERSVPGRRVPFCAFNGGNDVFVDIGDKSWGVRACQVFFGRRLTRSTGTVRHGHIPRGDAAQGGGREGGEGEEGAGEKSGKEEGDAVQGHESLHIGDQFLSAGANDFKARTASTTAWIANPDETVALLDFVLSRL